MKLVRVLCAAGLLVVLGAPLPSRAASTKTVTMPNFSFDPERITINVGDTIRWINTSDTGHSVTSDSDSHEFFDSSRRGCPRTLLFNGCMRRGQSFSHTFDIPGTFVYHCRVHGSDSSFPNCGMCGRIKVVRTSSGTVAPTAPGTVAPTTPGASVSVSPSGSASPTLPGASSGSSPLAGGPGGGSSGTSTVAIAIAAVTLLAGSGFLVYRNMIRR